MTAPAIYLIETGRTRPSLPTLEHIARRTGKPVEFFLAESGGSTDDTPARLIELEALVADGRHLEAIALGRSLLDRSASAFRLGRIRFMLGQAYLGTGELDRAAGLLEEARAHFEAVNDGAMLAECLGALAALATSAQSKEAVALAEAALEACRRLNPTPASTESRLLGILAAAHAAAHDLDQAAIAYEEAIRAGSSAIDLRGMARTYAELGVAYRAAGEVDTAVRHATRSLALLEVLRDRAALARAENNLAQVLMGRQDFAGAHRHIDRALAVTEEPDLESGRARILLSACELEMHEGNVDLAEEHADKAMRLAERIKDGATLAESHVWLGRIADRRSDHERADREFDLAIRGFEGLGMHERLLQTHGVFAEILERRGELNRAYVHMKQALQASRPGLLRRQQAEEQANSA